MRTLTRTLIILSAALFVAAGLLALAQTEWAAGAAAAVVAATQTAMTAQYDANVAAGIQPAVGGRAAATAANLTRMLLIAAAVIACSTLLDRRARRARGGRP